MATGLRGASNGKRSDIFHVPLDRLHVKDGWNVREMDTEDNKTALRELVDSIKAVGVKQPLTGYFENDTVYISDGHRRLAAARIAVAEGTPILTLPVQSEGKGVGEAERVSSMLVRNSGKPLSPFEQSKAMKRLIDFGWSPKQVAELVGKTSSYVNQLLQLQAAPEDVKRMVKAGAVSAAVAVRTSKKAGGVDALKKAVETAKAAGKKRATPKAIAKVVAPAVPAKTERQDNLLAAAALLLHMALPERYATAPAWWPGSNAAWEKLLAQVAEGDNAAHYQVQSFIQKARNAPKEGPKE